MFVDCVENAYDKLTDGKEIINLWEKYSSDFYQSGRLIPGDLRREFEKVAKYNAERNKNEENEKNNYLEDFDEADDTVLNNNNDDDVGVHNNLMRNGTVNNDDVDLEDIKIRWDQDHDFSEKI